MNIPTADGVTESVEFTAPVIATGEPLVMSNHANVNVPLPVAATLKVAVWPRRIVSLIGSLRIVGPVVAVTVRVTALLITLP
jgi:hypothetical protein